jgi:Tol biopolymer transport system component
MKKIFITCCLVIAYAASYAQVSPTIQLRDSARIVSELSTGDVDFRPTFTPDGNTMYFTKATIDWGYIAIFYSEKKASGWTSPEAVNFTGIYRDTDPLVSADGKRLYFGSDRPLDGKPYKDYDYHFYYVALNGGKIVSEPVLVNFPLTGGLQPSHYFFAANGNAYFSSSDSTHQGSHIYMCEFKNGSYQASTVLTFNGKQVRALDPVVANDEHFIIFLANQPGGGGLDLWVSFNNAGIWSDPINMGSRINTKGNEGSPGLSRDNKTLYFSSFRETTGRPAYKDGKITTKAILDVFHSAKNGLNNVYQIDISDLKQ